MALSKQDRQKRRARGAVRSAIEKGEIKRPRRCSQCGTRCKPEAHHPDYSKPLDILWLCKKCHVRLHGDAVRKHGTASEYTNHGCRCKKCKDAHTKAHREYMMEGVCLVCGGKCHREARRCRKCWSEARKSTA